MELGKRSIISIFEYYAAHEPERVWALRPKNENDLVAGFERITYDACMGVVGHAAQWLRNALPASGKTFDAFAYQGPSDIRVILLCLAAAKLDKQILLPSRRASPKAQQHLVQTANCVALVHAKGTDPTFNLTEIGVPSIVAPELADWLEVDRSPSLELPPSKTWADGQDDPWILLHTSGTTGLPKIVCYTQKMMAKLDAQLPQGEGPLTAQRFSHGSWFTSIPLFHFVGLCIALQFTAICGSVAIVPPVPSGAPALSIRQLTDLINVAGPYGIVLPPVDIERLTASDEGFAALKKVKCVNFVGAQLRKVIGDRLVDHGIKVMCGLGTTEAGSYPQLLRSDDEWDWCTFPEAAGATFERYPCDDDVYELVFYKQPKFERFQQVFLAFPGLEVFRTKDLYYKHPTLKNTWKVAGRSDDFLKLSSGHGMLATPVEESILGRAEHLVSAVLVDGHGRDHPCILVSPKEGIEAEAVFEEIWPLIKEVNQNFGELSHIRKDLILVTSHDKPFKLNGKGAVSRRDTTLDYGKEMEILYNGLS